MLQAAPRPACLHGLSARPPAAPVQLVGPRAVGRPPCSWSARLPDPNPHPNPNPDPDPDPTRSWRAYLRCTSRLTRGTGRGRAIRSASASSLWSRQHARCCCVPHRMRRPCCGWRGSGRGWARVVLPQRARPSRLQPTVLEPTVLQPTVLVCPRFSVSLCSMSLTRRTAPSRCVHAPTTAPITAHSYTRLPTLAPALRSPVRRSGP